MILPITLFYLQIVSKLILFTKNAQKKDNTNHLSKIKPNYQILLKKSSFLLNAILNTIVESSAN